MQIVIALLIILASVLSGAKITSLIYEARISADEKKRAQQSYEQFRQGERAGVNYELTRQRNDARLTPLLNRVNQNVPAIAQRVDSSCALSERELHDLTAVYNTAFGSSESDKRVPGTAPAR